VTCASCFSSSLAAVSVTHGPSKCAACLKEVDTFEVFKGILQIVDEDEDTSVDDDRERRKLAEAETTKVLRIDNVAWVS
jgi:hypothetical protein